MYFRDYKGTIPLEEPCVGKAEGKDESSRTTPPAVLDAIKCLANIRAMSGKKAKD